MNKVTAAALKAKWVVEDRVDGAQCNIYAIDCDPYEDGKTSVKLMVAVHLDLEVAQEIIDLHNEKEGWS